MNAPLCQIEHSRWCLHHFLFVYFSIIALVSRYVDRQLYVYCCHPLCAAQSQKCKKEIQWQLKDSNFRQVDKTKYLKEAPCDLSVLLIPAPPTPLSFAPVWLIQCQWKWRRWKRGMKSWQSIEMNPSGGISVSEGKHRQLSCATGLKVNTSLC